MATNLKLRVARLASKHSVSHNCDLQKNVKHNLMQIDDHYELPKKKNTGFKEWDGHTL